MDKAKFVYVTYISTTPEKLWDALTNPEMTRQYWGNHRNASDWQPGSPWRHEDYSDPELRRHRGEGDRERPAAPPGALLGLPQIRRRRREGLARRLGHRPRAATPCASP